MRIQVLAVLFGLPALAQDRIDLGTVDRIKTEAFGRSKVMDHLYSLTEANGPRLTGSPNSKRRQNRPSIG
jgi:carboxypeptidase Q